MRTTYRRNDCLDIQSRGHAGTLRLDVGGRKERETTREEGRKGEMNRKIPVWDAAHSLIAAVIRDNIGSDEAISRSKARAKKSKEKENGITERGGEREREKGHSSSQRKKKPELNS